MNLRENVEMGFLLRSGSPVHSGSLGTQPCMGDTVFQLAENPMQRRHGHGYLGAQ